MKTIKYIFIPIGITALILLTSPSYSRIKKEKETIVANLAPSEFRENTDSCYNEINYAQALNDRVVNYLEESFQKGTKRHLHSRKQIYQYVAKGKLAKIEDSEYYIIGKMRYSYPFLTLPAKRFLIELGERFHRKLENTDLACSRFKLTSLFRTTSSVERMMKRNKNSIKNSSHLHGTSFDISYSTFISERFINSSEATYLAGVLAKTIWEMRKEGKCYATYEIWQSCFHIVVR
jgi:hypothetical protein